jgi:predicted nucleotidyltransferase
MNAEDGIVRKLYRAGMLNVEQEFAKDVHYEGITGSVAYGINVSESSDTDVVGICIPPVDWVFPHVTGNINGFGPQPPKFDVTQQHHIMFDEKQYDVAIYGIVKFFQLCAENNPNMIDVLYLPDRCITHIDPIGKLIRQNRKLFLTRHAFHKYIGYSYSQMKKMETMNPKESRA